MKIAVTSTGTGMDSRLDTRFGRCASFVIYDTESEQTTTLDNASRNAMGGAGISAAQLLADKNVDVVITGNVGPNAHHALNAANIEIYQCDAGDVKAAIAQYKGGNLSKIGAPSVGAHAGQGGGRGMGGGRGGGRGR